METIGWMTAVLAVGGALMNNRLDRRCFYLWLLSNALSGGLHVAEGMTALAVRDFLFFLLAAHGLCHWSKKQTPKSSIENLK
jgi:nicotinamide riboside transporter PnuC